MPETDDYDVLLIHQNIPIKMKIQSL